MKSFSREDFLQLKSFGVKKIDLSQVAKGVTYIKKLSVREVNRIKAKMQGMQDGENIDPNKLVDGMIDFIIASVCDAEGNNIFTKNDYKEVEGLDSTLVDFLAAEIMTYNSTNANALKDSVKN